MTVPARIGVGVGCWLVAVAVGGVVVGSRLMSDEQDGPDLGTAGREDGEGGWLVHHCPRCEMDIEYIESAQLPAVKVVHGVLCPEPTSSPAIHIGGVRLREVVAAQRLDDLRGVEVYRRRGRR